MPETSPAKASAVRLPIPVESSRHMRCGECLHYADQIVSLVGQKCPRCGLDYAEPKPRATYGRPLAVAS